MASQEGGSFVVLAGDVGGTNCRFALYQGVFEQLVQLGLLFVGRCLCAVVCGCSHCYASARLIPVLDQLESEPRGRVHQRSRHAECTQAYFCTQLQEQRL